MDFWHVDYASQGRMPLLQTEELRRAAARTIWRVLGKALVLFGSADDHLHHVVHGERGEVGRLTQASSVAIGRLAGRRMKPAYIAPVVSRSHMENLLSYLLGQPARHGLSDHPALWSASAFLDLVGARVIPGASPDLRLALPRHQEADVFRAVGLSTTVLELPAAEQVRQCGAGRLVEAAGAALAVGPTLRGNAPAVAMARRAASRIGVSSGIPITEVATAVGVGERAVRGELQRPVPDGCLLAILRRLAIELLVEQAAGSLLVVRPGNDSQGKLRSEAGWLSASDLAVTA